MDDDPRYAFEHDERTPTILMNRDDPSLPPSIADVESVPGLVYYVDGIPDIRSETRYNHALALGEWSQRSLLITHELAPERIRKLFDDAVVLTPETSARDVLTNARRANKVVRERMGDPSDYVFLTGLGYSMALAGFRSDAYWVVDLYDDPIQSSIRKPLLSPFHAFSRIAGMLINRADHVIHTLHPALPRRWGRQRTYAMNGSATTVLEPETDFDGPVTGIWAGKTEPYKGFGILVDALTHVDGDLHIEVFGEPYAAAAQLAAERAVDDMLTFHGAVKHPVVCDVVERANFGLCILTPERDQRFAYPLKVGEYLAGGAIPVASDFPGMRFQAQTAGFYAVPEPEPVATRLNQLLELDESALRTRCAAARRRAEAISWEQEREWFRYQVVESCVDVVDGG